MRVLAKEEQDLIAWDEEANDGEELDYDQWEEKRTRRSELLVALIDSRCPEQ